MKKRILILASALLLTGCAKGFSPLSQHSDSKPDISGEFEYKPISEIYDIPKDAEFDRLTLEDGCIIKSDIDGVYKLNARIDKYDFQAYTEEIGKAFVGNDYRSDNWKYHEDEIADDIVIRTAEYITDDYSFTLRCNNSAGFVYSDSNMNTAFRGKSGEYLRNGASFKWKNGETAIIDIKVFDELIDSFNKAIGYNGTTEPDVIYKEENDMLIYDYKQKLYGLRICNMQDTVTEIQQVDLRSDEFKKASGFGNIRYVTDSDGHFKLELTGPYLSAETEEEYDSIISLDSALRFFDELIADNSGYILKNAELKYLLIKENDHYSSVPVWEFVLQNKAERKTYGFVLNAITGEYSFVVV